MTWMAWTAPTAAFFITLGLALCAMILLELRWPTVKQRGFLPLATTRGDRFFISLLSAAFIHLLFLGLVPDAITWAGGLSVLWALLVLWRG
jgi:predicted small integral membrane protein